MRPTSKGRGRGKGRREGEKKGRKDPATLTQIPGFALAGRTVVDGISL